MGQNGYPFNHYSIKKTMPDTVNMAKKSAAITGAGSGPGRKISLGFASKGYKVFCNARRRIGNGRRSRKDYLNFSITAGTRQARAGYDARGNAPVGS
jgi:NAD(P)-dependent dehydrogenase (short-subunit alcohol dehydrogenase family)